METYFANLADELESTSKAPSHLRSVHVRGLSRAYIREDGEGAVDSR
jgi:hypothetical protein